jgi:hypothetical protein
VVDALVDLGEDRRDAEQALVLARAGFRDLEDLRLGLIEQLVHFLAARRERAFRDLGRHPREAPLHRALAHELRVAAHVERARRVLGERGEIRRPAGLVLVLARVDRFRDRHHVGRPRVLDQLLDVLPDAAVVVAVEIVARDDVGDAVECLVIDEERAEERLLGFHGMRRHPQRDELRIGGFLTNELRCSGHLFISLPGRAS